MNRHAARKWRGPLLLLAAVVAADVIARHLFLVVVLGAAAAVLWCAHRGRAGLGGDQAEAPEVTSMRAQLDQARAENTDLRARVRQLEEDLARAREAAHAAWDASASLPPRPASEDDPGPRMTRLLSAPLSGARPLTGGGQ